MTVILTVIHGVWMGAGYALDGPFDVNHIFLWTTMDAVNPLAGELSLLMLVSAPWWRWCIQSVCIQLRRRCLWRLPLQDSLRGCVWWCLL